MQFPLNQFETLLDKTILKRGLSYYKDGSVTNVEETEQGVYEALVEGSEDYDVELKIEKGTVVDYDCTCPYDHGPICKHIVAVLFYLQQDNLEKNQQNLSLTKTKEKAPIKQVKKKTIEQQLNELLDLIPHEELKDFIRVNSLYDTAIRNVFMYSFTHYGAEQSKEFYSKQIKSVLHKAKGRDGFIGWGKTGDVEYAICKLLENANKQLEVKNFKSVIYICTAVMEELIESFEYTDDSNGDIGGCIDEAYYILSSIDSLMLPEELRVELFDYCCEKFENKTFSASLWHLGILRIASGIILNDKEAQRVIDCIDHVTHSKYDLNEAQEIKFSIINKFIGEKEAEKYLQLNLSNPNLRRLAVQLALKEKSFKQAVKILQDGIKQDEKNYPGLAFEWYDWLLKVSVELNDKEKIIEYAKHLIVSNYNESNEYYLLLKRTVQPLYWGTFVENIIKEVSSKKAYYSVDLVAKILINEEMWHRLFDLVKLNASLNFIIKYEKHLSKDYSDELVLLYEVELKKFLGSNMGRNHYQTAVSYLNRMIALGGKKTVEQMVSYFKQQYPQRRALIEELSLIKNIKV